MKLPLMQGVIERRLLVNYRVDADVIAPLLPKPFRPQLVNGAAVAGICLIRLGRMRIKGLPAWTGLRSENAAHRVAVEWDTPAGTRTGVYIPRRDSNSVVNRAVGGRLYPGEHHRATFRVEESDTNLRVAFTSQDGTTDVDVHVRVTADLSGSAVFDNLAEASAFFEKGAVGFSATGDAERFDGLELRTRAWKVEAAEVVTARSSFFSDPARFPPGSATLDSALLMRHVPVTWAALPELRATHPGDLATDTRVHGGGHRPLT
jgi:hypothetical protein